MLPKERRRAMLLGATHLMAGWWVASRWNKGRKAAAILPAFCSTWQPTWGLTLGRVCLIINILNLMNWSLEIPIWVWMKISRSASPRLDHPNRHTASKAKKLVLMVHFSASAMNWLKRTLFRLSSLERPYIGSISLKSGTSINDNLTLNLNGKI